MKTPFPDDSVVMVERPVQAAPEASEDARPAVPTLTVTDALTRWRDGRDPRFAPLLAAGELHGVVPSGHRRPSKRRGGG